MTADQVDTLLEKLALDIASQIDLDVYEDWDSGFNAGLRNAVERIRDGKLCKTRILPQVRKQG